MTIKNRKSQLKQDCSESRLMFDPFIFNSYVESGTIVKHYFLQDI